MSRLLYDIVSMCVGMSVDFVTGLVLVFSKTWVDVLLGCALVDVILVFSMIGVGVLLGCAWVDVFESMVLNKALGRGELLIILCWQM